MKDGATETANHLDSLRWQLVWKVLTTNLEVSHGASAKVYSQIRYLLHELVFACSDIPPRPHKSFTLLTQFDWCALRTVARWEVTLLPVAGAMRAGSARDLSVMSGIVIQTLTAPVPAHKTVVAMWQGAWSFESLLHMCYVQNCWSNQLCQEKKFHWQNQWPVLWVLTEVPRNEDRADSPCSERADLWKWDLAVAGNCCHYVRSSFQAQQMLDGLICTDGWIPRTCFERSAWLMVRAVVPYESGI